MKGEKHFVLRESLRYIMYEESRAYTLLFTLVLFTWCIRELGIRNLCSFLVSREATVLRGWESGTFRFSLNIQVDEDRITTVKDLEI